MLLHKWRRPLLAVAALIAASIAFAGWYRFHYSMDFANSYEMNDPRAAQRVLIATQGSEFKDAVVSGVAEYLKTRGCYVKVVDVSALPGVKESEWNAIVVLHTWEMRKPPGEVKAFVERARDSGKLVVLTTSGAGTFRIEGIDAISSASVVADAPDRVAEISARVDAILNRQAG